jgi:error-prone DNA polymerase
VYVSAWIKYHYPDVFCAALLNSQPMGFYAPAQLVRDAREHGVEIHPIDVNHSNWETTLEPVDNSARHAVRLGLHMVSGLPEKEAQAIVAAKGSGYRTPYEIARRSGCSRRALDRLAQADACNSMTIGRRQAIWKTSMLGGKIPPLFAATELFEEPDAELPSTTGSQEVLADYLAIGLTLREHPLTFLRPRLKAGRVITVAELKQTQAGKVVLIAGLVLFRQHPQTAKETIFITIEDETGAANLIVWKHVHEKYHAAVYHAKLLACRGVVQREGQVLHVVARDVWDWSSQLKQLDPQRSAPAFPVRSRDFR